MKIVNKKNGRIIASGKFELGKISGIDIDAHAGDDIWIFFRYSCYNLISKKYDFDFLYMTAEISAADNRITIEASNEECCADLRCEVRLEHEELERLASRMIKYILTGDSTE